MNPKDIASQLVCPQCGNAINMLGHVSPGHSGEVRKGLIVCCLNCVTASIVGDAGLEGISPERFKTLDERTQRALKVTLDGMRQMKGGGFGSTVPLT